MVDGSVIVIMGVSGSGKTTIGKLLAEALSCSFADADQFHPAGNIEKMQAGIPLSDADRGPWLEAIKSWVDQRIEVRSSGVVTCSALKLRYRKMLAAGRHQVKFVYLKGSSDLIRERLRKRTGHFMPATLLDSQFEALEEPKSGENMIVVSIEPAPEVILSDILGRLVYFTG